MSQLAFVDVDTQIDFMRPNGGLYVPKAETLDANLARLMAFARRHDIPVIASADAHAPDDPEFAVFPPHCVSGTPGQQRIPATELGDAKVVPNQPVKLDLAGSRHVVLEKTVFDLFDNPNAEAVLAHFGARHYVVFGVATDYCVRAAALGLRKRGFDVTVVSDAVKAVTSEGEATTLAEFAAAGIQFQSTAEVTGG